jgi:hypothetical protein
MTDELTPLCDVDAKRSPSLVETRRCPTKRQRIMFRDSRPDQSSIRTGVFAEPRRLGNGLQLFALGLDRTE